jgi:hypothetical protein
MKSRVARSPIWAMLLACGILASMANRSQAERPWVDARQVGPFVFEGTFPLKDIEYVFEQLPALEREMVRTLGVEPARQPVTIYLFANAEEHRAYLEMHHPKVPYRRALYIKSGGQAGVFAYLHPELEIDLRHECTHALLHNQLVHVPLWLDEGLAEYFEVPEGERAFDHPHFGALRWDMRLGMVRSVSALEERRELIELTGTDYRFSWAWVHFMLHGPAAAHETLVGYLAEAREPGQVDDLSDRLEQAVPHSTDRMVQHFKHWHR